MPEKKPARKFITILIRDAAFCACFIYLMLQAIQAIPIQAEWLKPAGSAFKDFDWSDLYFSKIKNPKSGNVQNPNIVVINIANAPRAEIAKTLFQLYKAGAKVVGLDVLLHGAKERSTDALLDSAITLFGKKIIVACYADSTRGNTVYSLQSLVVAKAPDDSRLGYVNFVGDENPTVRSFYAVQDFNNRKMASFAFHTFIKYNDTIDFPTALKEATHEETIIPYQSLSEHYTTIEYREIIDSGINFNLLKDKIVLVGFAGNNDGFNVIDDKHFTPLNERYAGKALPDMFGVYIHANIIEGYIDGYKINPPASGLQIIGCIFIIFLFLMVYMYSESREHVWKKVVEISLQLLFGLVIIVMAVYFLSSCGMKWDIGEMIAAVALAEPLVGFYRVIIHYLGKIYNFKSIFLNEE